MRDLKGLLDRATSDQLAPLVVILDTYQCRSAAGDEIIRGVGWLHRNLFEDFHREVLGEGELYSDVLVTLLRRLGVETLPSVDCENLEALLIRKLFEDMWRQFNATQRLNFAASIEKCLAENGKTKEWLQIGGIGGALVAAQLGGFGTYLLASTALHGIGGSLGVIFPFGLYKAVSTTISVAIGPLGWASLAIYGLYKLTGTNYQKLIPAAVYIAILRYELGLRPNKVLGRQVIPHDYSSRRGTRML